ncbi:MAG: tRNA pseudouridine(38-40) synthase TruA [Treponema sp.]|jgi:tRNA pseudouridine38-40 synthase|nr:tRNA pseudouridine(38-40) synthase TruA [Treponema sp.]
MSDGRAAAQDARENSPRNIRLLIAYDGAGFSGWQRQGSRGNAVSGEHDSSTVQGVIEAALKKLHKKPVTLTGSGRTDAGVHATGQVANFHTGIAGMEACRFVPALNSLLPREVRILESRETRDDFHARFDAKSRTYRYRFITGRSPFPHETRYALPLWRRPGISLLNDYARLLLGETDCSVFASSRDPSKSRSRHITQAWFLTEGDVLVFEIRANAFLWKMVRSIAGTLLYCEERGLPPKKVADLIRSGDRSRAGPTLPPQGLFFHRVDYYRD